MTDRKVGTIRVLTPITAEGQRDPARATIFLGEGQIMTQMGPLPISFEIPAANVGEAVLGYGEAAKKGIRETVERIRKAQEEASKQIVMPGMPGYQSPGGSGIAMP